MEEPRWFNSAEEYRTIQSLAREGSYHQALERAERALQAGNLGRKHTARLGSLICWLLTGPLQQSGPAAVLHAEEALRLGELINDPWVRSEALSRLVPAYCHLGDLERASVACERLLGEVAQNPLAVDGGPVSAWLLKADLARAGGDLEGSLQAVDQADAVCDRESIGARSRIRVARLPLLLALGRRAEARRLLEHTRPDSAELLLEWDLCRAWLTLQEAGSVTGSLLVAGVYVRALELGHVQVAVQCQLLQAEAARERELQSARRYAQSALSRSAAAGRLDLVAAVRRQLADLI